MDAEAEGLSARRSIYLILPSDLMIGCLNYQESCLVLQPYVSPSFLN